MLSIKIIHRYRRLIAMMVMTLVVTTFVPSTVAKLFDGPVDKLPVAQRVALKEGKVILTGEQGQYVCRILVNSSMDNAWQVLTDYNNFADFVPGIAQSKLIGTQGDRKIVEQVNQIRTLVFKTSATIRLAMTELYPQEIAFNFVDGDLDSLDGSWLLEPVAPYPSAPADRVLITHQVTVEPNKMLGKGMFYNIYENTLENTLVALKNEMETRYMQ